MDHSKKPSLMFLLAWHALAVAILLLLPRLKFDVPFWRLDDSEWLPLRLLVGCYVVAAVGASVPAVLGRPLRMAQVLSGILAVFGLVFLFMLVKRFDSSRAVMFYSLATAMFLIPLSFYLNRVPVPGLGSLLAVLVALLFLNARHAPNQQSAVGPRTETALLNTGFYNLHAIYYHDHIPNPSVSGGGLAKIGDELLLATGDGHLYVLGWKGAQDDMQVRPLPYRVPVNGDEFAADTTGKPWRRPGQGEVRLHGKEDASDVVITWWFRVAGLLVAQEGERVRVFASHYFWKRAQSCWVERVSVLEQDRAAFLSGEGNPPWKTVFETQPCLPIKGEGRRRGTAFAGHFGGGRMVMQDADTLLLSVGDFGFNGIASTQKFSQDPAVSYGKIIEIHLNKGTSEIYSLGNRNPQGLYRDPNGVLWDTEHGPQGGDELNLIKKGANYGWPYVTYGTDYGTFAWPLNPQQGEHEGFEAPFYAWLPSVGISDLIGVEKDLFPIWKGDLLVASLVGQTLFRVRVRNDRVAFVEPIAINNRRIRDIVEAPDGRIVLWEDDDNTIVSLRPLTGSSGEALFAANCSGCHKVGDGTSHRIGPDLWGVVGRGVAPASNGYLGYSPALSAYGGQWTPERLSQFLENPQAVVPGSAMEIAGVADAHAREQIIDYLKSAKKVVLQ